MPRPGRLHMRMNEEGISEDRIGSEAAGEVKVRAPFGLSATVARSVVEVARSFQAAIILTAYDGRGRGHRADARNLLELLLLGAGRGEAVTLQCIGDDGPAAYEAIVAVLGQPHHPGHDEIAEEEVAS